MKSNSSTEKKTFSIRKPLLAGLLVCLFLLVFTWLIGRPFQVMKTGAGAAVSPLQRGFTVLREWLMDPEAVNTKQAIIDENEALKMEIDELNEQIRLLKQEAQRAENLEALYNLDTFYKDYPKIAAEVIGLSPNNWLETYLIDKGSADGIQKDMPVIAEGGLIGHITEVYPHYAVVTSLLNQSTVIYGQVDRGSGDLVAVQGMSNISNLSLPEDSGDLCLIYFETDEVDITVGDEIMTSSLGDIYPPGLLIGTVSAIEPIGSGYESVAYIKPAASLDQVKSVLVITEEWKRDMKEELQTGSEVEETP